MAKIAKVHYVLLGLCVLLVVSWLFFLGILGQQNEAGPNTVVDLPEVKKHPMFTIDDPKNVSQRPPLDDDASRLQALMAKSQESREQTAMMTSARLHENGHVIDTAAQVIEDDETARFIANYDDTTLVSLGGEPVENTQAVASTGDTQSVSESTESNNVQVDESHQVESKAWVLQIGSFGEQENAQRLLEQLKFAEFSSYIKTITRDGDSPLYRVYVGPFLDDSKAKKTALQIKEILSLDSMLVAYKAGIQD